MVLPPIASRVIPVKEKSHFLCRLLGHKYIHTTTIKHDEMTITFLDKCQRCGNVEGSTTIGPFSLNIQDDVEV